MAKDNRSLGRFHLDGIMPSPRGVPQIEVTLDLDSNSVLTVTSKDKATGKVQSIRIEGGSKLTPDEIEKMKRDAELNAESDRIEKEKVDKLNQADTLIFQTEKQIKEHGDKISDSDKAELNSALEALKEAHKSGDVSTIDSSITKLNDVWNKVSTEMYKNTSNPDTTTPTDTADAGTVDADYQEIP
jgi:molecular chaperone DnaK